MQPPTINDIAGTTVATAEEICPNAGGAMNLGRVEPRAIRAVLQVQVV